MEPAAIAPETESQRLDVLDGLRGLALIVVVLSHSWLLYSVGSVDEHHWTRAILRNGNAAVTVFLVASGYLTYRALSGRRGLEKMRLDVTLLRRILRVGPSLWLMLGVLMLVAVVDSTDTVSAANNRLSVLHVLTYTWNWFVQDNLLNARPDLGHLWYLSVDMQAFVLMSLFVYMLRRRPVGILFALLGFYLLLVWWRFHLTGTEDTFFVLLRTTARMDAFVLGVLVGAAVSWLAAQSWFVADRRWLDAAVVVSLALLLPLFWWCAINPTGGGDRSFLRWGGTMLQLDLAVFVGAIALGGVGGPPGRALAHPVIAGLGRRSLSLYIWHFVVFHFVARHTTDWDWPQRVVVAALITVSICVAVDFVVERRVVRLLRSPRWRALDAGVPAYVRSKVRRRPVTSTGETASDAAAPAPGAHSRR